MTALLHKWLTMEVVHDYKETYSEYTFVEYA